jgi:uncharacterized protein YndB with AHSA1/START domain
MGKSQFVDVTYISVSPEKLWNALIEPKLTRKYWQHENASDWKPGSKWEHRRFDRDRTLDIVGEVMESSPPQRPALIF